MASFNQNAMTRPSWKNDIIEDDPVSAKIIIAPAKPTNIKFHFSINLCAPLTNTL